MSAEFSDETLMTWFVRAEVKSPPDSIASLAREYSVTPTRITEGIAEIKAVLDQVDDYVKAGLIKLL